MIVLLDTHSFLWFIAGSPRLSPRAREVIEDPAHDKRLSIASLWEIAIKVSLGKLVVNEPVERFLPAQLEENGIEPLPIRTAHALKVAALPFHHRDPFDRLLVAQCLTDGIPLVSTDAAFDPYGVTRWW